jgi:hypothetical protein
MSGHRGRRVGASLACGALVALLLPALAPDAASAQVRPRPPAERQEMERRVQQRFQARVAQELGLDAEQVGELGAVATSFQAERRALVQREMRLRQRLTSTGPLLSDEAARSVLEEMAAVQEREAELLRREQARLLEFLSPSQTVRFYTLRGELADQIRRLQGAGPRGGPGGGPGGGAGVGGPGTSPGGWGFE